MNDININLVDDDGVLCDLITFRDGNGNFLGIAKIDSMDFTLPEGTVFFDYYHQAQKEQPYVTRCVIGEKVKVQNENEQIVKVQVDADNTREFNASEGVQIVKVASSRDELVNLLMNEMLIRKNLKEEATKKEQSSRLAV